MFAESYLPDSIDTGTSYFSIPPPQANMQNPLARGLGFMRILCRTQIIDTDQSNLLATEESSGTLRVAFPLPEAFQRWSTPVQLSDLVGAMQPIRARSPLAGTFRRLSSAHTACNYSNTILTEPSRNEASSPLCAESVDFMSRTHGVISYMRTNMPSGSESRRGITTSAGTWPRIDQNHSRPRTTNIVTS